MEYDFAAKYVQRLQNGNIKLCILQNGYKNSPEFFIEKIDTGIFCTQ